VRQQATLDHTYGPTLTALRLRPPPSALPNASLTASPDFSTMAKKNRSPSSSSSTLREAAMRTVLYIVSTAAALTVAQTVSAQDKPRLLAIDGFMSKGVFTGLDPELMKGRLSLADIERLHFDGKSTGIEEILGLMARSEKMRSRVDEPLEVRGEIPVTLPPNTTGSEAYTTCFYAFTLNGLAVAGSGDSLILIRPETKPNAPRLERKWNREQVLPIRLFRLGYLRSDPILAQYKDKLGTRAGRAILEAKSNTVIVADKAASLEKLQRYIDAEVLEAMGLPAAAGHVAGDVPRPPSPGAIADRANIHFYLMTFARVSRIPMNGSKTQGVAERHYPEADLWLAERGYRALEAEYKRINEFVQLARDTSAQEWPTLDGERTLSPADQKKLEIHFGVISPEPNKPTPAKRKRR
jgi:hypothetical protein